MNARSVRIDYTGGKLLHASAAISGHAQVDSMAGPRLTAVARLVSLIRCVSTFRGHRMTAGIMGRPNVTDSSSISDQAQDRMIEQIVELQREFYFENKGKETERRRRLREIIERATTAKAS